MTSGAAAPFEAFARRHLPGVERELRRRLPDAGERPSGVHRAMRYSLLSGGKRLRPLLVLLGCKAAGGAVRSALPAASAVEMVHAYSLIHDDLPCMDDDDLRRGRPTCHRVFGEGIATLAGDGLLTESFGVLARAYARRPRVAAALVAELSAAAGSRGMVGGQAADLAAEGRRVGRARLRFIHSRKTGALLCACLRMGARLAGADAKTLSAITRFGRSAGLLFQVVDDLLDVVGDEARVGKRLRKDRGARKATYPAVFGLARARAEARRLVAACERAAAPLPGGRALLSDLARWLGSRTR